MLKMIRQKINRSSSPQKVTMSFLTVIFIGSLLLSWEAVQLPGPQTNYLGHLFMAFSMVCVNGLTVYNLHEVYNVWGQFISLLLIQIGGLGIVTMIALTMHMLHQKISLKDQYTLQSALNRNTNTEFMPFLRSVYSFTFTVEGIIALLFMNKFIPIFGWKHGIFNSIFLAVSSFCNAGFVNFDGNSLIAFQTTPSVYLPVALLIVVGGVGFSIWFELRERFVKYFTERPRSFRLAFKRFSTHAQIVLIATGILLVTGTVFFWGFEQANELTIGDLPFLHQFGISFFHSTTLRTSGFSLINYEYTRDATQLFSMAYMMIGGGPGGTAGGIKVTSIALIMLLFRSEVMGRMEVTYRKRAFPTKIIRQAFVIALFYIVLFIIGFTLMLITNPYLGSFRLMFETVSAISTAGLSIGITDSLSNWGRVIVMILMFIGRVGPITILLSINPKQPKEIKYAKADIILG